ncbi:hypothetical protein GCM10028822_01260 [Hymenobacter terrigena]
MQEAKLKQPNCRRTAPWQGRHAAKVQYGLRNNTPARGSCYRNHYQIAKVSGGAICGSAPRLKIPGPAPGNTCCSQFQLNQSQGILIVDLNQPGIADLPRTQGIKNPEKPYAGKSEPLPKIFP